MTWQAALAFGMSPTIAGGAQSQIRVRFRDGRETRLEMKRRIQEQGPANWTLLLSIRPEDKLSSLDHPADQHSGRDAYRESCYDCFDGMTL